MDKILGSKTVNQMTSNHLSNAIIPNDDFFGPIMSGMGLGFDFALLQDSSKSNIIGSKDSYW